MSMALLLKIASRAKTRGMLDYAVRYNPYLRRRIASALRKFHSSSSDTALKAAPLMQRMLRAARKTPYGEGRPPELSQWPILTKEHLRDAPLTFVNPAELVRIPAASGGTTGIPLKLWRSLECITAEQLFLDELLKPFGLSMRSRMAVLRADPVKAAHDTAPPYGTESHGGRRFTLSSLHLNGETIRWYVDALERFAPSILWVYPSAAANLYRLMERAKLRLKIPVILSSSEMLSGTTHTLLEHYFDATVINYYGQAERVCLASSKRPGEFYFNPGYGQVELIDPRPSDTGSEQVARIVATGFWNTAMPLIRYDTGDLIYVLAGYGANELAEVAAGKRPFSGLAGRDGEYVLTQDGMRIIGLNHIPREIKNISQLQIVQVDFGTVRIDVMALPGFSNADAAAIANQARAKLPASMEVTVQAVSQLTLNDRGKAPFVIRRVT
jgi:phenylacetate-CoA ligase